MSSAKHFQRGLYPTIAVSDAFNCFGHVYGACLAFERGFNLAGLGLFSVGIAAFVGVLRFGFSESVFAKVNGDLADLAAFVGLPLVGLQYLSSVSLNSATAPFLPWIIFASYDRIVVVLALVVWEAVTRGLDATRRDLCKILTNLLLFVGPTAFACYRKQSMDGMVGVMVFALAGVVITADRHRYIAGVRCENWFHYCIGFAAIMVARGL